MQQSKDQTTLIRHCMLYDFKLGRSTVETREDLVEVFGAQAPCIHTIRSWFRRFKEGNFDVSDLPRSGRPVEPEDQSLLAYLEEDPKAATGDLAEHFGVDETTIGRHLRKPGFVPSSTRGFRSSFLT